MTKNMLTILMPVFNCEKYIAQALDSILKQETKYKYSIMCVNDGSYDMSLDILKSYQKKYPEIIYVKTQENKGLAETILSMYKNIKTKYWCVLDADDYWVNSNHVQNALDFLEKKADYTVYTTGTYLKYNNGQIVKVANVKKSSYSVKNIKNIPFCHTSNTIFRNIWDKNDIDEISKLSIENKQSFRGDSFRKYYHINKGKIFLDSTYDSVYRVSGTGIYTALNSRQRILLEIRFHLNMIKFLNTNYKHHLSSIYDLFQSLYAKNNSSLSLSESEEFIDYLREFISFSKKFNFNKAVNKYGHISFFMPSRNVGGYQLTFMRFAKYISENLNIKVDYIDYEDGTVRNMLSHNKNINFIKYNDNMRKIKISKNTKCFAPITWINLLPRPSKQSNVMFWNAHPKSREWIKYRSNLSYRMVDQLLTRFDSLGGICHMDSSCYDSMSKHIPSQLKAVYCPGFVTSKTNVLQSLKNIRNKSEIHLCWIGRLDQDKIYSLLNLLNHYNKYETRKIKYIHIIGDGEAKNYINPVKYKTLNIKMLSTKTGMELEEYLIKNVDIMFGMGTSLLEAASLKIPSFLILANETEYNLDAFIPLTNLKNFVLGIYTWQNYRQYNPINLTTILNDVYENNKYTTYSNECFNFYNKHHRIEISLANMLMLLFNSNVPWKADYLNSDLSLLQKLFSIKNSKDKKHKIITIAGIKIKIKKGSFKKLLKSLFSSENKDIHKVITILGIKIKTKSRKLIEQKKAQELENMFNSICSKINYQHKIINELIENQIKTIKNEIINLKQIDCDTKHSANETYWANVYHDTILTSNWLNNKSVSPGRWAVSYIVLYVIYRILDEIKPISILECGLGQSSKLMVQYADINKVNLTICENNPEWADFFSKQFPSAKNYIKFLETEMREVISPYISNTYVNFDSVIQNQKFDFVFIDGPFGSKNYSRPELLEVVDNLADSFVVMLDDMNRNGEQETWKEFKKLLTQRNIQFEEKIYKSDKHVGLLCSPDLSYLTSL